MIQPANLAAPDATAILTQDPGFSPAGRAASAKPESSPFAELVRKQMRSPGAERKTKPQEQPKADRPEPEQRASETAAPAREAEPGRVAEAETEQAIESDEQAVIAEPTTEDDSAGSAGMESPSMEQGEPSPLDAHLVIEEAAADEHAAPPATPVPVAAAQSRKHQAAQRTDATLTGEPAAPGDTSDAPSVPGPIGATSLPSTASPASPAAESGAPSGRSAGPIADAEITAGADAGSIGTEDADPDAFADAPIEGEALPLPIVEAGGQAAPIPRHDPLPSAPAGPFRLELATARAAPVAQSLPSSAQPEAVEAQFARGLAAVLNQKGGSVTLRLAPESLGQLRVRLETAPGHVAVQFEVGSSSARELLDDSLARLRASLEAKGLTVDRASVVLDPSLNKGDERHSENGARQWTGNGQDGRHPGQTGDERRQDAPDQRQRTHEASVNTRGAERRIPTDDTSALGGAPSVAILRLNAVA